MSVKGQHIAVIGGGLIGASAAVRLQQAGAQVTLIDPGQERDRASFGNAGHIVIESAEPLTSWAQVRSAPGRLFGMGGPLDFRLGDITLWGPWALRYLIACKPSRFRAGTAALGALLERAIPAWHALAVDIGRPDLVQDVGYFHLWESEASAQRGLIDLAHADLGPGRYRPIDMAELEQMQALFDGRPQGGAYFENTAKLADPGQTVEALWSAFAAAGGQAIIGTVDRLEDGPNRIQVRLRDGLSLTPDQILVAAGARSARLMRHLGAKAPLVAERGYHLHFPEHDWPEDLKPILFADRFIYLTRFNSGARATSFTEIGRPDAPPDPRKWAALKRQLAELKAPVRGDGVPWMGCRPTLPDFLPAIGRLSPRALYALGHQHIGATLAAATAEAVMDLVETDATPSRLNMFDIRRFN
ncbi:MAG: FAD-binding oxidoreductase [Proteobacteria bacterium]|nr:FAD-binding oxidoreductase [Pseudomonadota bacterium]